MAVDAIDCPALRTVVIRKDISPERKIVHWHSVFVTATCGEDLLPGQQ